MNLNQTEPAAFDEWVACEEEVHDRPARWPAEALLGTIGSVPAQPIAELPLTAHWLYFHRIVPLLDLGQDGHPSRGGFLPPVALPRRMWAGGRLRFLGRIPFGTDLTRRSKVIAVSERSGRSGPLVLVTVEHVILKDGVPLLHEEQDLVYMNAPSGDGARPAGVPAPPLAGGWRSSIVPTTPMLFRYSALTFNSHRIHYDRDYARDIEGYPGLVVHGPLIATLLLESLVRAHPEFDVGDFSFRAVRPIFDIAPFDVAGTLEDDGTSARLQAIGPDGALCMEATARRSAKAGRAGNEMEKQ